MSRFDSFENLKKTLTIRCYLSIISPSMQSNRQRRRGVHPARHQRGKFIGCKVSRSNEGWKVASESSKQTAGHVFRCTEGSRSEQNDKLSSSDRVVPLQAGAMIVAYKEQIKVVPRISPLAGVIRFFILALRCSISFFWR